MTDKTPEEVLTEALTYAGGGPKGVCSFDDHHNPQFAAAILAAMPDYTLVRKDKLERLREALLLNQSRLELVASLYK